MYIKVRLRTIKNVRSPVFRYSVENPHQNLKWRDVFEL